MNIPYGVFFEVELILTINKCLNIATKVKALFIIKKFSALAKNEINVK